MLLFWCRRLSCLLQHLTNYLLQFGCRQLSHLLSHLTSYLLPFWCRLLLRLTLRLASYLWFRTAVEVSDRIEKFCVCKKESNIRGNETVSWFDLLLILSKTWCWNLHLLQGHHLILSAAQGAPIMTLVKISPTKGSCVGRRRGGVVCHFYMVYLSIE